jgi:hypothetical protein
MTTIEVPTGKTVGAQPRPRMLLVNVPDDVAAQLAPLAASHHRTHSLKAVRLEEFDVLVVMHDANSAASVGVDGWSDRMALYAWPNDQQIPVLPGSSAAPFRIAVVDAPIDRALRLVVTTGWPEFFESSWMSPGRSNGFVVSRLGSICTEFVVPDGLDPGVRRLVDEQLLPLYVNNGQQPLRPTFETAHEAAMAPFLVAADGQVLAGRTSNADGVETWILPITAPRLDSWVTEAFRRWRTVQPDRFRELPGWQYGTAWQSTLERSLSAKLEALARERVAVNTAFDASRDALETALGEATAAADIGTRRLLTGEGDDLVMAVSEALRTIGFNVASMDEIRAQTKGELLEDLRVTDPQHPDWIALVEVRSYKGGAKTNDLQRIGRFAARYREEAGRYPTRRWYVVNQFRDREPDESERLPVLGSNTLDVEEFAADGGLVIDTSQLYRIIESASENHDETRSMLRDAIGRIQPVPSKRSTP